MINNRLLYIIGNGFDLHHGVLSSYNDFGDYVQRVDPNLHSLFEDYFSFEGNWANFENTLANLDVDLIIDEASNFFTPYSAEDWSDADHHNYPYEIDRIVNSLSNGLKQRFTEWICGLAIPDRLICSIPTVNLDMKAKYLTFNYTNTLQKLYGVQPTNILHIHNQAVGAGSDLILGHSIHPKSIPSLNASANIEEQDIRITQANDCIDDYFSRTYKPTKYVISTNKFFFESLSEVSQVYVLGHSLSEVDWPYFIEIVHNTKVSCPDWTVSYRDESKIPGMMNAFAKIGVPAPKTKYLHITNVLTRDPTSR